MLTHVDEGPHKVLNFSARIAVIQRCPLVERINIDQVRIATPPGDEPEKQKYATTAAEPAAKKKLYREAWTVGRLLKHRRKRNGTLESLVQCADEYEPTWEPRSIIPDKLISQCFKRKQIPN